LAIPGSSLGSGVGGVITGLLGRDLGFTEFPMGNCKIDLELDSCFLDCWVTASFAEGFWKHACCKD
jgi:hypothetical protein